MIVKSEPDNFLSSRVIMHPLYVIYNIIDIINSTNNPNSTFLLFDIHPKYKNNVKIKCKIKSR